MGKYSKAIGAAIGGGLGGTGVGGAFLPEGSPWYAYVAIAAITAASSAFAAYYAPKNTQ